MLFFIYTGQVHAAGPPEKLQASLRASLKFGQRATSGTKGSKNTAVTSVKWLLSLMEASHRYDLPRMRLLLESCHSSIITSCGSGGQDVTAAAILGQKALENGNAGVQLVATCLEMLPDLDKYGARNSTESALGLLAGHLHNVVDSPSFEALAEKRPDLLQMLMDRVRERDRTRR